MSAEPTATNPAAAPPPVRAVADGARDEARLGAAIADLALPIEGRLDERTRIAVHALFAAMVSAIEREIINAVAPAVSGAHLVPPGRSRGTTLLHLVEGGALRDAALVEELLGRVGQARLAEMLPRAEADEDRPSLLARLLSCPDITIAGAARTLLFADNRRRGMIAGTELPAELHHQLVWLVAAGLRAGLEPEPTLDRALADAARRTLAAHDEGERAEAAAQRLAGAIDASIAELPDLLVDALGDGNIILFIAVLAHAAALQYEKARTIVLDPLGDRLWLVLRSVGCERTTIARIGYALAEADPNRDIDAFADQLDTIAAIGRDDAERRIATLRLDPDLAAATRALAVR